MTNPFPPGGGLSLDGIEVVELAEVDLDFAMEAFGQGAAPTPEITTTTTKPATPKELGKLELFRGLSEQDFAPFAPGCESIRAVTGYVVMAPGRLNSKVFFVLEGQMRLYPQNSDKRPMAVVDVGQSTGLRSTLSTQSATYAAIATETSHIIAIDIAAIDECAKRSHGFARNYTALLESYLRGDNCLHVGAHSPGGEKRLGYVDELTLLHNQHWLDMVLPRLVARSRLGDRALAVTAFGIDKLDEIIKEHGIGPGLRVLEAIGPWVLDQTRPTDILAINKNRHIFAFLPECDIAAARQLAGRLKTHVQTVPISLTPDKAAPIKVTLSFGVAELEKGMKENEFLNKTEALIQKSMKLGGDCLSDTL